MINPLHPQSPSPSPAQTPLSVDHSKSGPMKTLKYSRWLLTICLHDTKILSPHKDDEPINMTRLITMEVFTLPPLFWADFAPTLLDLTYPECQIFGSGMAGIVRWLSGDFLVHALDWWVWRTFTKPGVKFHQKWPDSSGKSDGSLADSNGHQADSLPY